MTMAVISIGVIVRDGLDHLRETLASLSANTGRPFDLTLLGDGVASAALAEVSSFSQSATEVACGNAACFNRLIERTQAGFYLLLEAGAKVAPGWLDYLIAAFDRYPRCGLAGPSTNRAANVQCVFPAGEDTSEEISRLAQACVRRFGSACRSLEPMHSLSDFCYLVRHEVIDAIGKADEVYGLGPLWEMDYNIRAARAGFPGLWACASYVHRAPATEAPTRQQLQLAAINKQIYQEKFGAQNLRSLKQNSRNAKPGAFETPASKNVSTTPITADPVGPLSADEGNAQSIGSKSAPVISSAARPRGNGLLPKQLSGFRGLHDGGTIVVCGCGVSLKQFTNPQRFTTIGVNDVGRLFHPNYLVVVNPRNQFQNDRFRYVEESQAEAIFTQLELGLQHPHVVRFNLGKRSGTDFFNPDALNYTSNSPYIALCLAVHMGARRVGIIGVDFTHDHFFAQTGVHALERQLAQIDREYKQLYAECVRRGVEVFNMSRESRLTAFPKMELAEFEKWASPEPAITPAKDSLKIVSYSTMPVAGVPAVLARCIAARTSHECRTVWARNSYGNGVAFQGDVEWEQSPAAAAELLASAQLVIAHNGKVEPSHRPLLAGKPVITLAHNYMWNVDGTFVQQGFPGLVVGQYQATLPEFKQWMPVPNPMPLWEDAFRPAAKTPQITICYTPSGKHESYPAGHQLYWHSKGYETTMRVLERLEKRFPIRLEVIRAGQISHLESLAMKKSAHIVIDECVTGSYHRNSLEGLALGCVVVNGMGRLPQITQVFRHCAGNDAEAPFVRAGLDDLEAVLTRLIEQGAATLVAHGKQNREWMERHWDFQRQWQHFWEPVVDRLVYPDRRRAPQVEVAPEELPAEVKSMFNEPAANELKKGLSVVVCHGGQERLPQLTASLANLRQCEGVNEIIVVDMGSHAVAEDIARRWADKYIFVRNDDVFERARSLNIGTALGEFDLVFWIDNDLIMPPDFMSKAVAEMRATQLDYLIPYSRINYLSAADTKAVIQGVRNPADCPIMGVYFPLRSVCGAAGIARRSFILAHGGMSEEFKGWGGEDDAWWHKAKLLGRAAATQRKDQPLYHLFHANSGAYGGTQHRESNPYYPRNLALLHEMRSVRDRNTFAHRFPPRGKLSCGWEGKRVVFLGAGAAVENIAHALDSLVQVQIECQVAGNGSFDFQGLTSQPPDGLLIFENSLAHAFFSDPATAELRSRTILVHNGEELGAQDQVREAGAIVCTDSAKATRLKKAGFHPWNGTARGALALIQPLSIILGGTVPSRTSSLPENGHVELQEAPTLTEPAGMTPLPVWMYWEGPCPEWIKQCQRTVFRHAPDVRLLSPQDFDKLRDADRDIDLKRLHVAQRADYIRAYLLARYGGLWIDSDCIVMQSLQPVLDLLNEYDFLAHRERTAGLWANDFMGAARDSKVAASLYQRICSILRPRHPVGWTALGCVAVTETLRASKASWFEIKSERIQPVCWSDPKPFLAIKEAGEHQQAFDRQAICYMLSNLTMQKEFKIADLSERLLKEGTFFSYLLGESMQAQPCAAATAEDAGGLGTAQPMEEVFTRVTAACSEAGYESSSGPGSSLQSTAELRQRLPLLLQDLEVRSVLDAACGDGNWMKRLQLGIDQYVGVDVVPALIAQSAKDADGFRRKFIALDVTRHRLPQAELVLCRDCLVHFSYADIFRALRNFRSSGAEYLLVTTFANLPVNTDIVTGDWRPVNFRRPPFSFPEPLRFINEKCTEGGGRYSDKGLGLWKLADLPLDESGSDAAIADKERNSAGPAVSPVMVEAFNRMVSSCVQAGYESRSGPGSSLNSTAVIRAELPSLIQNLGAKSLLDAPCGDFNWMRHTINGELKNYIGIDVIPDLIDQNQKSFGGPTRRFLNLDITRHLLPQVDLIFCRDCLVHFSYKDIAEALRNFKKSKSRFLLTTTFPNRQANHDIATGDWQPLNLQAHPFNFPPPLKIINEKCWENGGRYTDKSLALWELATLP